VSSGLRFGSATDLPLSFSEATSARPGAGLAKTVRVGAGTVRIVRDRGGSAASSTTGSHWHRDRRRSRVAPDREGQSTRRCSVSSMVTARVLLFEERARINSRLRTVAAVVRSRGESWRMWTAFAREAGPARQVAAEAVSPDGECGRSKYCPFGLRVGCLRLEVLLRLQKPGDLLCSRGSGRISRPAQDRDVSS